MSVRVYVATAAAALVAACVPAAVSADPVTGNDSNGTYLALGDSVAFGYVPAGAVATPNYQDQHSFVGYPDYLAQQLGERVSNAACPGETSTSLLVAGVPSYGCENEPGSLPGYRTLYQLHVQYQGTQIDYALSYLHAHRHTQLVTLDVGANDVFLCQATTADHCSSPAELGAVLATVAANIGTIVQDVRSTGYQGPIVVLDYYALNYADPVGVAGAQLLDSAIAAAAHASGALVADGFGAFAAASASSGGDPCAAGLLIPLATGGCDVHPTARGAQVLAAAIAHALGA